MKSRGLVTLLMAITVTFQASNGEPGADLWQHDRPANLPQIKNLEVMCAKDHMEVQLAFDKPFTGLVFSKGQFGHDNCVYVQPKSGQTNFRFSIVYNGCGTKPDAKGKFYENTVVVQYDEELIEVWDEAKRLRCEWYNDYEKTATKPPMVIADLEVVELNFRGDNVDCWMEIQNGKGPWASPINGIVPLGSTLTMVVAINDLAGEFDMRVKSCEASDGVHRPIQLSDEHGCVLRPKMVSKFLKLRSNDGRSTVMSYAFFHAFKFPDSLQVFIRCKVEICRHGCPDHCDKSLSGRAQDQLAYNSDNKISVAQAPQQNPPVSVVPVQAPVPVAPVAAHYHVPVQPVQLPQQHIVQQAVQQAVQLPPQPQQYPQRREQAEQSSKRPFFGILGNRNKPVQQSPVVAPPPPPPQRRRDNPVAAALVQPPPAVQAQVVEVPIPIPGSQTQDPVVVSVPAPIVQNAQPRDVDAGEESAKKLSEEKYSERGGRFPHGPRSLNFDKEMYHVQDISEFEVQAKKSSRRTKRSYSIPHERRVRSADVGVKVGYEVVSAVDLAFSLGNATSDGDDSPGVTIFQGKMREEVVYGICLPAPGFSALFVLLAMCVVISVLVAAFLCYHRQLQKADREGCAAPVHPPVGFVSGIVTPSVPFRDWGAVHFVRNPKSLES